MRINKLFGALAFSVLCAAGMAYAAMNASDASIPATQADEGSSGTPVTVEWAVLASSYEAITAESTPSGLVSGSFEAGSDIRSIEIKDLTGADGDNTKWKCTSFGVQKREAANVVFENEYVDYVITPINGKFLPVKLSGYVALTNSGNQRVTIKAIVNGKSTVIQPLYAPLRANSSQYTKADFYNSWSISDIEATSEPIIIRFELTDPKTNSGDKAIGIDAIKVEGVYYAEGEEPDEPEPDEPEPTGTVIWPLGVGSVDEIVSTSTMDVFETSFVLGSDIESTRLKNVYEVDGPGWDCTQFQIKNRSTASEKGQVFDNEYVEFIVTPKTGKFKPTHLSFYAMMDGFGDGHIRVTVTADGVTKQLTSDYNKNSTPKLYRPASDNDQVNKEDCKWEKDIAGLVATDGPVVIRLEMWNSNTGSNKRIGLADVTITGEYYDEGVETPEFPEGWAVIPGTLNKVEIATDKTEAGWTIGGTISYDNQDGQFGSIKNGGWCSTNFFCDKAGAYDMVVPFRWENKDGQNDDIHIQITDQTTGKVEIDQHYPFTGGTNDQTIPLEGVMARGRKTIKFTFTSPGTGYITNIMAPTFNWVAEEYDSNKTPSGYLEIPGTLTLSKTYWTENGLRIENENTDTPNFGWASEGANATAKVFCKEAGVYSANIDIYGYYAEGDMTLELTDEVTGQVEAKTVHHVNAQGPVDIVLGGKITAGKKALKVTFTNVAGNFCANFYAPVVTKVADEFAKINNVTVEGIANSTAEGYDWNFLLPETYAAESLVLNIAAENGAVKANGEDVVDGKVTIATPAPNQETIVNLELTANEGAFAAKTNYAVRVFHIGGVEVSALTVDGRDVTTAELLAALNSEAAAATLAGNCYTKLPAVSATMLDGTVANANVTLDGTTATATFTGKASDKTKTFTLTIEGIHTYTAAETDKTVEIKYDAALKGDKCWSNGLYTIQNCNDGYSSWFKLSRSSVTWEVPANIIVKQMVMKSLKENYDHVSSITSVVSGDATVYLPTNNQFVIGDATAYDLIVNFENHVAGTPIEININSQGQPMAWFEFIVEEQKLQGEPTVQSGSHTQVDTKNHCVVALDFGRQMQDCVAEYNGKTVKAEGGTPVLRFSLWELAWGEDVVLTIPAGAAKDVDGNTNSEAITYTVSVAQQPTTVEPVSAITYVANVDELKAAIANVMETNKTADAPRHIIFLKNGDYDLGTATDAVLLHLNRAYNVSIIGEDRDNVVVHGTVKGISYPVFSVRYSTNTYLENFTIKNDAGIAAGQAVALHGGNREVMVNMLLLGYQDTFVTGEQGYYKNCEIHGTVDFICGGGDHYFDTCEFVIEADGSKVCAPNTSAAQKWGYVFQNCSIKGNGYGWYLGRPWDGEPRATYLNTTMDSQPADTGWDVMGNLTTHFYEYNSMDASGNALDLSGRGNSPTSTNTYNPILNDEEAAQFTIENVLGGNDSWLPTEDVVETMSAPEGVAYQVSDEGNKYLYWHEVNGAAGYLLYNKGEYLGYAPGDCNHFDLDTKSSYKKVAAREGEDFSYTIRAISPNGTMSAHSMAMTPEMPTGVDNIAAEEAVEVIYYNLQGQPVAPGYRGAVIKLELKADGTRTVSKAVLK